MSLTRRRFTQILASTLFLHHLPSFAQSVKFWASLTLPEAQNITRIVSAGAPADLLLLAVAPEKMVGFSSLILPVSINSIARAHSPVTQAGTTRRASQHTLAGRAYGVTSRFGR